MGKIATQQYVSTFADGGTLSVNGNKGATRAWIRNNFPHVDVSAVYENNKLVQQRHLLKKRLEITKFVIDGNDIQLRRMADTMWENNDTIRVESLPTFTAVISVANVGERYLYPLFDMETIKDVEFSREYESGPDDTATITYRDIYIDPSWNKGPHEASFWLANEMSPNYEEVYAFIFLKELIFG